MTVPFICVLVAFGLTFVSKLPLALAMGRAPGGYDNHHPRDQQALLEGWGRRALAAHLNSFEAFPAFAAAVVIAHLAEGSSLWASRLALVFVGARFLYIAFYIADLHVLRSLVWTVGLGATLCLFLLPWMT